MLFMGILGNFLDVTDPNQVYILIHQVDELQLSLQHGDHDSGYN